MKRLLSSLLLVLTLSAQADPLRVFVRGGTANRGEEVTDEVIDSPQSLVVAQAANRMHVQKGLLAWLLHEVE